MKTEFVAMTIALKRIVYDYGGFQEPAEELKKNIGTDYIAFDAYMKAIHDDVSYLKEKYLLSIRLFEVELCEYFDKLFEILCLLESVEEDADKMIEIMISQLSSYELYLIFYHGISGRHTPKFLRLVDKFQLLKNITIGKNKLLELHKVFYPNTRFVNKYSSDNFSFDLG